MSLGDSLRRRRSSTPAAARRRPTRPGWGGYAAKLVGLAAVGLSGGYLVATRVLFPIPKPPGDLVEVPSLEGMPVGEAEVKLADAGLVLGAVEGLRHPAIDSGAVVGQGPIGGQLLTRGASVRITVSLGPQRQAVPDVMTLVGDRAFRVLESSGFQVAIDSVDSDLPAGSIVAVDPPVGTLLGVPATVRVTLSRGPLQFAMPYLLGMPVQQATDSLIFLGFAPPAVDTVFRFGRDQGLVVEQLPLPDSLVARDAEVRLTVGRPGG